MYANLYVYKALRLFMSGKLYWRYKKDGKWTWKPANVCEYMKTDDGNVAYAYVSIPDAWRKKRLEEEE